jgi:hypothetical protein
VNQVLKTLQIRNHLLQVQLLSLHLDDLLRQILICGGQFLVLVLVFSDLFLQTVGRRPGLQLLQRHHLHKLFLELLLHSQTFSQSLELVVQLLSLSIPLLLLVFRDLGVAADALVDLPLQVRDKRVVILVDPL